MSINVLRSKLIKFGIKESEIDKVSKEFKLLRSGRGSKYNNMKVEYKGDVYHSLSEAYVSYVLNDMLDKGELIKIEKQVKYPLENMNGKKTMSYITDFVVTSNTGKEYIIDVKGRLTVENKVKLAYWTYVYKKKLHLVYTSGAERFDLSFIV